MVKGLWADAITEFKKALKLRVNDFATHQNLPTLYSKKALWSEAVKEYRMALLQEPKNCEALYGMALSLDKRGDATESLTNYMEFLKVCDKNPQYDTLITEVKHRVSRIKNGPQRK